jgi:hypothetical protein
VSNQQRFIYMFSPGENTRGTSPEPTAYYEALARAQRFEKDLRELIRDELRMAGSAERHHDSLIIADAAASEAHDAIYAVPFKPDVASAAIWRVHDALRPLIE